MLVLYFLDLIFRSVSQPNWYLIKASCRFYAAVAKTAFKGDGQQSLHHFWCACFLVNSILFLFELISVFFFIIIFLMKGGMAPRNSSPPDEC